MDRQCIGILLATEKDSHADYFFEANVWDKDPRFRSRSMIVGINRGLMRLHKRAGDIELIQAMPEDTDNRRFQRAASRLRQHWENNELPRATQFACG